MTLSSLIILLLFFFFIFLFFFFFFNDTATTEIYTLSLHDALPISSVARVAPAESAAASVARAGPAVSVVQAARDRKSTRLNSSHSQISYAVFCLKKKKKKKKKNRYKSKKTMKKIMTPKYVQDIYIL